VLSGRQVLSAQHSALFSSDGPQEVACQYGADNRSAIAEYEDHLIQMFDLEAIVQCIPKPMRPMAQAKEAEREDDQSRQSRE